MQITISCDDGCDSDYKLAKLLEKYDLSGIFFWPVDIQTLAFEKGWEPLTPAHEAYIARNFEIGSHTVSHRYLTKIPLKEAVEEIKDSKRILENKYDQNISKFCYPRGYSNPEITQAVKDAGYSYGRSTLIGHIGEDADPHFAAVAAHMGCPVRPEYQGTTWLEQALKLFEEVKASDKDYHVFCHSWEIDRYNEWKNVEYFLREISK